jgi:hypothetical protein
MLIITSMAERSSDRSDGVPERAGRALAHAVARGRVFAGQLGDPAVRDHLVATGRSVVAKHGPDVADQAAQRAVDRALWRIAVHAGFVGAAVHRMRPAAGRAAGKLARSLAARARRADDP